VISGTPTAAGATPFTVMATNAGGTDTKTLSIMIYEPPTITTLTLPDGAVGTAYSQTLAATGSTPITWSVSIGSLPAGLSLSAAGVISGTPTAGGATPFTVMATNAGGTDTKTLSIMIYEPPTITTLTLPDGTVGTAYSQTLAATGLAPITWSVSIGSLPAGLTLSAAGVISGTPTAAGTASFTVMATNAGGTDTQTITITIASAPIVVTAPNITGQTSMTLTTGYAATSTGTFTLTGNPAPSVTLSGNAAITWNSGAQRLDIAAGLATGTYTVVLTASNGIAPDATLTFTLTVDPPVYHIYLRSSPSGGGSLSASATTVQAGQYITVVATPARDYELQGFTVNRNDNGQPVDAHYPSASECAFTMPASDVTVTATFLKTDLQSRWERAKALIEATLFTVTQQQGNDPNTLRFVLADIINRLIASPSVNTLSSAISPEGHADAIRISTSLNDHLAASTDFTVSPYDIVIFAHRPATAGDSDRPTGVDGSFGFRVSPAALNNSAYADGTITATPHDPTGNDVITGEHAGSPLRAWTQNGTLHVSGLISGEQWSVYNLNGILIFSSIATERRGEPMCSPSSVRLPDRGIYIVTSGTRTVKVIN
jgi:PKD repeat protein